VTSVSDRLALEEATLRLVNAVAFMAGTRAHSRRLRAATGIELPPSYLRFIELLSGREPAPMSVVARDLGIDLAQASRQAGHLEAAGHIVRNTDPDDRRRTLVALSASTTAMLDEWLLAWSRDYLPAAARWRTDEIACVADWFALAHHRLVEALPDRPRSAAADRWAELAGAGFEPETRHFLHTMISFVTWISQSRGFDDLLELIDAPVRQTNFFTLQVIRHSGPLPIAEVAERLAIDPSQASKRLRELTDLRLVDRAVDGFDRRSNLIRVSRKGVTLLTKVAQVQMTAFEGLTADLSPDDRRRWTPLVQAYVDRMLSWQVGVDGLVRPAEPESFSLR
jgi:DNA-binding MarR family transcriptional regulator